jgi:hypothetical protein
MGGDATSIAAYDPSVTAAREQLDALDEPWRVALGEAWTSWATRSAGVGAVIAHGERGIVAVGRNRIGGERTEPGVLASTFLAHAEMHDWFADLPYANERRAEREELGGHIGAFALG